jgi:hypothetical protein
MLSSSAGFVHAPRLFVQIKDDGRARRCGGELVGPARRLSTWASHGRAVIATAVRGVSRGSNEFAHVHTLVGRAAACVAPSADSR